MGHADRKCDQERKGNPGVLYGTDPRAFPYKKFEHRNLAVHATTAATSAISVVGMAHRPQEPGKSWKLAPSHHAKGCKRVIIIIPWLIDPPPRLSPKGSLAQRGPLGRMNREVKAPHGPKKVTSWTAPTEVHRAPKLPTKEEKTAKPL